MPVSRPLDGQLFLVTGGGGAIGRAIAAAFAGAGARVVIADRHRDPAAAVAASLGGVAIQADLSTMEGATRLVGEAARLGPVEGLVHAVGGYASGPFDQADEALYDHMFDLNVRPLFHVVRALLPSLRTRGRGFVAALASEPAWTGTAPGSALYGASKSAAATLLRSLDGELAGTDVAVTTCYPMGAVDTPANRAAMPEIDPSTFIDPDEIAAALLFAATRGPRGRIPELAIYPRRPQATHG